MMSLDQRPRQGCARQRSETHHRERHPDAHSDFTHIFRQTGECGREKRLDPRRGDAVYDRKSNEP